MQEAQHILSKFWGYSSFRSIQEDIIESILQGKDTFGLMPTGGGKSLCFQVPAMMKEGIALVISPLVALMKDQVQQLQKRDIKAIALTGGISSDEVIQLLDNCQFGNYKFLYVSPERLEQDWVLDRIKGLPISLIAIDEAHCVSQWGHDFRPSYLKIKKLKASFSKIPFVALTASATLDVQKDIIELLGLENPSIHKMSFARNNLGYHVIKAEDKLYKIQQILHKNPLPSIIYVRSRKFCHEYASKLNALGYQTTFYHGGLTSREKEAHMNSWLEEKTPIMIATNAFGMGIDKANVKTVIHVNLPESLESYYQEAGRAGRNGEKSFALLLFSPSDVLQAESQFLDVLPDVSFLKEVYIKLCNYLQIAYGEGINQEFAFRLNAFCVHYKLPVLKTFNAIQFLDRQSILSVTNENSEKVQVQFKVASKEVIRYASLHAGTEPILSAILRNYPGIFDMQTNINLSFVAKASQATEASVLALLESLSGLDMIDLFASSEESKITFLEVREDEKTINRVAKFLEKQNLNKKNQFASVMTYVADEVQCKSKLLLTYFGESNLQDCGICSICLQKKQPKPNMEAISGQILSILKISPKTSRELAMLVAIEEEQLLSILKELLSCQNIGLNSINQFTYITS